MSDTAREDQKNLVKKHLDKVDKGKWMSSIENSPNSFQMGGDWYTTEEGREYYDRTLDNIIEWHRELMRKAKQPELVKP